MDFVERLFVSLVVVVGDGKRGEKEQKKRKKKKNKERD